MAASASDAFRSRDPIDARLRVFRQADHDRLGPRPHCTCLDRADEAPRIHTICGARRRLGCGYYRSDGCTGTSGIDRYSHQHGWCCSIQYFKGNPDWRSYAIRSFSRGETRFRAAKIFFTKGVAYALEMGNRPQTLYGIADSPVGLAAWILDHDWLSLELMSGIFEGHPTGPTRDDVLETSLTRDDILDNITLYWLTNTAISSARLYWENKLNFFDVKNVSIPVAVSAFPYDIYTPPRSWQSEHIPNLFITTSMTKAGILQPGNNHNSFQKMFAQASGHCANNGLEDVLMSR